MEERLKLLQSALGSLELIQTGNPIIAEFEEQIMSEIEIVQIQIEKSKRVYKTKRWKDLEDLLYDYDGFIADSKEKGEDDMVAMYKADKKDLEDILELLNLNRFEDAADKYSSMDTCVREEFPDRIYDMFDAMELI